MAHRARLDRRRAPRAQRASSLAALVLLAASTACGGGKSSGTDGAAAPTLQTIEVLPANASIPKGLTRAFRATGHYSDGSTRDLTTAVTWSSSAPAPRSRAPSPASRRGRATARTPRADRCADVPLS